MKKTKLIKIIFILGAIVLLLTIIINVVTKNNGSKYEYSILSAYKDEDPVGHKKLKIKNASVLKNIGGELPVGTISKMFATFYEKDIAVIYGETMNLSDTELKKYYLENINDIDLLKYIDEEKSFLNLVNKLRTMDCNFEEDYEVCEFEEVDKGIINVKCSFKNGSVLECELLGVNVYGLKVRY